VATVVVVPGSVVAIVMFRRILDLSSFRIDDDVEQRTLASGLRHPYDALTLSSSRTGPVHVRLGGWMHGPAMDR
jgi:hypothetical protein